MMVDDYKKWDSIHYGSSRCKIVARSVIVAEIQSLVVGFCYAFSVKHFIEELIGRNIRLEAMVDSNTFFNVDEKDGQTAERRIQIDVLPLRQNYDIG